MSQVLSQSYASSLVQAVIALIAVCLLAVLFLRISSKHSLRFSTSHGIVKVIQRVILEPRRSLYLVQVGSKVLLIGISEAGGPQVLAELGEEEIPGMIPDTTSSENLVDIFQRWIPLRGCLKSPDRVFRSAMSPVARSDDESLATLVRTGADKANGVIPPERREEELFKHPLRKNDP